MLSKVALSLLQVAVLARLLAPSDFGLMALVTAVIAFAQIFSDMGISNAIIHHQKISQEALSSLYWLNVLASAALMLLLMLLGPFIAMWYQEPKMQTILTAVATTFLIVALSQQLRIIAEKKLLFPQLAIIELTASLLGFLVSVTIAYAGGGVYALVAGMLVSVIATTVLSWWILADGWRPLWRLRLDEVREFLSFGAYTIGFSLTNTINMQADVLIGGRVLGTSSLGVYTLPKQLSLRLAMMINPIVTRVGMPLMARIQNDRSLLKSIYLKTLLMTASVNFPLYFMITIFSQEIVAIVFGDQWNESVPILRILALWALVRSTGNPVGSLLFALGRAKLMFWWSFCQMLFWIPIFWVGAKFGIHGLAISLLFSMVLTVVPLWYILVRPSCGAEFFEYFKQLLVPFAISALAAGIGWGAALPFEMRVLRVCVGSVVGGLVYLALSRWFNRAWFAAITELLLGRVRSAKLFA